MECRANLMAEGLEQALVFKSQVAWLGSLPTLNKHCCHWNQCLCFCCVWAFQIIPLLFLTVLILNGSFPNIWTLSPPLFLRDESLSGSDITSKLEPAFLSGLRCAQPLIRAKFFEVFDASMKRRVYERLLYICCSQNWEAMGSHFWIKQCIEVQSKTHKHIYLKQCFLILVLESRSTSHVEGFHFFNSASN